MRFIVAALGLSAAIAYAILGATAGAASITATPSTLASAVSKAQPGDTILLAAGSYGTWAGTSKAVTLKAADGAAATMRLNLTSGDGGFTLDGLQGMGGSINGTAHDITIRNATFTAQLDVEGPVVNVLVDRSHFDWRTSGTTGANSKVFLNTSGQTPGAAFTLSNSTITNGDLDGVHFGGGSGDLITGNEISNLCDVGVNHTDNVQFEGGTQIRVAGNYVHETQSCATQGITAYDGETNGLVIEDNVVDVPRDWGIELYSDQGSVIRHNTMIYRPKTYTEFGTPGGQIAMDRKSQDPAGAGTLVYDNVATDVGFADGSTGTQHNNVSGQQAVYVGPVTAWAGYALAPGSAGKGAASDGLDAGIRAVAPVPTPTPTASPTPSPSPSPTDTPTPSPSPIPTATPYTPACAPTCDQQITALQAKIDAALAALNH